MRLKDKVAIVVGAGQSPGEGIGNGRATALTFAREGAKVLCVDHNLASVQETVDMIAETQGTAAACKADVTKNAEIKAMVDEAIKRWGRIDVLHNNVGVSLAGGDAELDKISEEALDRCIASATIALISASLVTSALNAAARPPLAAIISSVSCAEPKSRSTHNTLAPSRAKVSAVARPLPMPSPGLWPAPTTMATFSFRRMSIHSGHRVLL